LKNLKLRTKLKLWLLGIIILFMIYAYQKEMFWEFYLSMPAYLIILFLTRNKKHNTTMINANDYNDYNQEENYNNQYNNDNGYDNGISNTDLAQYASKIEETTTTTTTRTIYLRKD
jgi:hypothetical protein